MLDATLLKQLSSGGPTVVTLLSTVRVSTPDGAGTLIYLRQDGYLGVRLDGETRVDEWAVGQVSL